MSKWVRVSLITSLLVAASTSVTEARVITSIYIGGAYKYDTLDVGPTSVIAYGPDAPEGIPLYANGTVYDFIYVRDGGIVNLAGGHIKYALIVQGGEVHISGGSVGMYIDVTGGIVAVYGTNFVEYAQPTSISLTEGWWIPSTGNGILLGEYANGDPDYAADDIRLWFRDSYVPIYLIDPTPGPVEIPIDIKPGSDDNPINLRSRGVVPVAIFSTADFDATSLPLENIFFAGAPVCMHGKSGRYAACYEDVDGDYLIDLVIQVETQDLDPAWFDDDLGGAYLVVCEEPDPESTPLYFGWDTIALVRPW